MRFVADTNIIISGLLWHGPPRRVLESAREAGTFLFTSPDILSELDEVMRRPKFAGLLAAVNVSPHDVLLRYAALAVLVHPVYTPSAIARDPDDNMVLACAIAAGASHVVSGDRDLLDLDRYQGIEIVTATKFLECLAQDR